MLRWWSHGKYAEQEYHAVFVVCYVSLFLLWLGNIVILSVLYLYYLYFNFWYTEIKDLGCLSKHVRLSTVGFAQVSCELKDF